MSTPVLMGLDLSLTETAMVAVPLDWRCEWPRVRTRRSGYSLPRRVSDVERIGRCAAIAGDVVTFARFMGVTRAYLEGYAFSRADQAHSLGELGGIVRLALMREGIEIETVVMSTARGMLLGSTTAQQRKDAGGIKQMVFNTFKAAGAKFRTTDESDAMAVCNFGLCDQGGGAFIQVAP